MTKFKQIIGRGTRINEEFGKPYFSILDFRNATDLFADKDFDGDPIRVKPVSQDEDLSSNAKNLSLPNFKSMAFWWKHYLMPLKTSRFVRLNLSRCV